ncbi:MAG: flagellar biosynthesis protein FlhB [Lachnospiraceae bacterium]|nr:flagellar biosynthesis protein FlhB [Lachnospiraceae bacterium]
MIKDLDLQFFAKDGEGGEKTEEPTPKKMEDSRKDGSVAKSKELATGVSLLALFVTLRFIMGYIGPRLINTFSKYWGLSSSAILDGYSFQRVVATLQEMAKDILLIVAPFLIVGLVVGVLANALQFKWMVTTKPMEPKLSKINPLSGFKRIFSSRSLVELLKAILMIGAVGYVAYSVLIKHVNDILLLYDITVEQSLALLNSIIWDMGIRISAVMLVIGVADFAYQKWKHKDDLKMTKQEVKDEFKNSEGDPQIKGQQKQRMRQASQRRMMQAVPEADVVITNPTHFAVALKYDVTVRPAPVVVAKGADFLATKIKDVARENNIEIVENKPLARMLYYNVDIDDEIPPELYEAVANILAYIIHLRKAG